MSTEADDKRRRFPRTRSFWKGRVIYPGRLRSVECTVRDFSPAGARIDCAGIMDIPDRFELEIPHKSQTFDCRVAWRRGSEFGIEFKTDTLSTVDTLAASLKQLQEQNRRLMSRLSDKVVD